MEFPKNEPDPVRTMSGDRASTGQVLHPPSEARLALKFLMWGLFFSLWLPLLSPGEVKTFNGM